MDVTIDVGQFVSEDEIKEAVLCGVRDAVRAQYSGPEERLNRLVSNLSYAYVFEMVNRQFDGKLEDLLMEKTQKIINELSPYSVFHRKDAWEKEDSVGYKLLQAEMANSRPAIKARIEQIIQDYPFHELSRDEIGESVYQCIMDKLFGRNETDGK